MIRPKLRYFSSDSSGLFCRRENCPAPRFGPQVRRLIRFGFYYRSSDRAWIQRYRCRFCRACFSRATAHPCFGQKKRQLNAPLRNLLASNVSHRRTALLLGVNRKTVDRKLRFMGQQARLELSHQLGGLAPGSGASISRFQHIQLDEMESFEHTKCRPVSIPLVVETRTRLILGVDACSMPAHGPLAEVARRKYGFRPNHRIPTLRRLLKRLEPIIHPLCEILSDSHPYYPSVIRSVFPKAKHIRVESRQSSLGGQGELKKIGRDPIFSLNHTAAMYRANLCRLIRRTWCTTKKQDRLQDHLALYAVWHNHQILHLAKQNPLQKQQHPKGPV